MTHCKYVWFTAPILVFLACGNLAAQDAQVFVTWKIAPACGVNFPGIILQQDLQDQLHHASIAVSRIHTAGLLADFNCQSARASIRVEECLSLSQAISEPSAANGLHLAGTWRNCQAYVCSRQTCGRFGIETQHALVGHFIPAFRELMAKSTPADSPPTPESRLARATSVPVVYAPIAKPVLNTGVIFYVLYILTCIAVFVRWQLCH